ncbi:Hsp20/alpha crystallin family protein [Alsobacter sp. R-9]
MDFRSLVPFNRTGIARSGDPFTAMRREMDRLLDDFTREWPSSQPSAGAVGFLTPRVNLSETEAGLEMTADLPGIDPKDIALDVADNVLTLKAERKSETEQKDEARHWHLVERSEGTYMRRFALPFEVDEDRIEASFDKGVLKVTVPRAADTTRTSRRIEIKSGA